MSDIFFSADLHIGDKRIIQFRKQFTSTKHHDETIIENWNSLIKPADRVYLLGDAVLGHPEYSAKALERLNGLIFLIRGDHDKVAEHKLCRDRFVWIKDYLKLSIDGQKFCLSHYPMLSWDGMRKASYHLHAHQHRKTPDWPNCRRLDVGQDGHEMRPWSYEEVDRLLRQKPYPSDHQD